MILPFFSYHESNLFHCDYRDLHPPLVNLILTSPPYNIGSKSPKVLNNRKHGGYDAKSFGGVEDYPDTLPEGVYQESQREFLAWCAAHLAPEGVIVYNHKDRWKDGKVIHPHEWFPLDLLQEVDFVIWDRGSTHNHATCRVYPHVEFLYVFARKGEKYYFKNQPFPGDAVSRGVGNVWRIPPAYNNAHNAPMPLLLAEQVILRWSQPGALVCDPYSGSGTTFLASLQLGRQFIGSEIEEKYCELTAQRLGSIVSTVAY